MFLLQDVEETLEDPLSTKESHIFYSKATPQLFDDASGASEVAPKTPRFKTKIVRLLVKLVDSCRPKKQFEIKQKLDQLMEKLDYALVFQSHVSNSERAVNHELFKSTFNLDFKEFKYIVHKKFASMKEFSTTFVTICTQSINTLKEVFHPMYEIHKTGKDSEKIKLNHEFDELHPPKHWIFSKLGRILTFEVPYSVVQKFIYEIKEQQKYLRLYPHQCTPENHKPVYRFYMYVGFNDPDAVQALTRLTNMVRPSTMKQTLREPLDKDQTTTIKHICERSNSREAKCEFVVKAVSEDLLEIDFYSIEELKTSREKFQEFQKIIRKLLNCDPKLKKKIQDSINLSFISKKEQGKDDELQDLFEILKEQPDAPEEEGEKDSNSFISQLNSDQSSKIQKAINR